MLLCKPRGMTGRKPGDIIESRNLKKASSYSMGKRRIMHRFTQIHKRNVINSECYFGKLGEMYFHEA